MRTLFIILLACSYGLAQNNGSVGIIDSNLDTKSTKADLIRSTITVNSDVAAKKSAAVDTAGIEFLNDATGIYSYQNGTLPVFGANTAGHVEFAQLFPYFGSGLNIEKILVRFGAKLGNYTGNISVKIYNVSAGFPTTTIKTIPLSYNNIDTTNLGTSYTVVDLSSPTSITSHFAVSIDESAFISANTLNGTTFLWSTAEDESYASDNVKVKDIDGNWANVGSLWSNISNVNLLIFPVVSGNYATGINETEAAVNGIKISETYPSPSNDLMKINYEIDEPEPVSFELIDITGKVVVEENQGEQSEGEHSTVIDVSGLPSGVYYIAVSAGNKRVAKKVSVSR